MTLFIEVILPIFAVFAAGFALQRIRMMDVRSVSAVTIYLLAPALIFITLYDTSFDSSFIMIFVFMLLLFAFMVVSNKILGKIFNWTPQVQSASILATGFMNSGNYGLPVVLFSLGPAAIPYAVFIMVVQGLMNNFFGVYYASRGRSGIGQALLNIFKMPPTHAAILALLFKLFNIPINPSIHSMITIVGEASIPVMMIVLGMQLGSMTSLRLNYQVIISAVSLKMIVSPIVTYLFVLFVDIDPMVGSLLIIISAMPTAAMTTMYAIEFDTEPDLVSSITFISTVLSLVTVAVVLNLLN